MNKDFNSPSHAMVLSEDGSYTAYSKEYEEHYHSTKDGALHESLSKHVIPALERKKHQKEIVILDICFGLGFNTFATLYYCKQYNLTSKLRIYTPELDANLIKSLPLFHYPKEFEPFRKIIESLATTGIYSDDRWHVEVFIGDAREYIKKFEVDTFDIIYQDAFSPKANPVLWTLEYFADIAKCIKPDGLLTTYSIALQIRLALFQNDFNIFLASGDKVRDFTIASKGDVEGVEVIDMKHKISINPDVRALRDSVSSTE